MTASGDRSDSAEFTDAQIDELARRVLERHGEKIATSVSDLIFKRVQLEIGKSALRALAYVAGAAVVAAVAAMSSHQGFWNFIFDR